MITATGLWRRPIAAGERRSSGQLARFGTYPGLMHYVQTKTHPERMFRVSFGYPLAIKQGNIVCPHGDSNPSFGLERATS